MAVLLNRPYQGYRIGAIVSFDTATETALIQQNFGVASTMNLTTAGQVITSARSGVVAAATGATGITVINENVDINSHIDAYITGNASDTTATYVNRVTVSNGSFLIVFNAAVTGPSNVLVAWEIAQKAGISQIN